MKILSINTSEVKDIDNLGKIVATGIFKQAREGKVFVHKDNLEGDAQADLKNHGGAHKAVYAFSSDHYDYWRKELSQPDLKHGVFGENLTISSLDEAELCIGDKLSIGQCILEISQPRVPCFKLGLVLKDSNAPFLFTKSYATGIYFRVVQEGFIASGDVVEVIKNNAESVSVQALFRSYFDVKFADAAEVFNKALTLPELAPEWREKVIRKISKPSKSTKSS